MKNMIPRQWYALGVLLFFLTLFRGYAQGTPVTGRVTDDSGAGLPGVTVLLKDTATGTSTSGDGNYSLTVPNPETGVLVFSFVGYKKQEVPVSKRTSISVAMSADAEALSDVVVVGYGEQRRSDITGAISSVSPKELKDQTVARVDQALQGRSPGVVIQNNDASPNSSVSIRIRGSNSLAGGNDPLVVINGFIGGDLASINPNDIDNIEVLKDASATAIYGSRGANGVILEASYADLWKVSNKLTNREFIFLFNGVSTASYVEGSHLHVASRPGEEGGWDDMMSEARFFNAFPAGPRKDATFHTVFTDAAHTTWQQSNIGQPYMAKYRDAGAAATANGPVASNDGDGFFVMSRYAEVLLIYAEAANIAEGSPSPAALAAINQVRRRAGGGNQTLYPDLAAGLSQSAFDAAVLAERAWELAFENKRWFDLVRKEKVVEVNKALYPNVSAKNQLLPKPQKEVDMTTGLKQNIGY